MGAPCPTLSPLGGIGITIAEIAREAGDQISWRDSARGQKCRVSALVLSMTMAWMPMPLAVPKFFQVVRGHGRDDFDLSFVTYLPYLHHPTYRYLPTYTTSYPNQTLLVHIHQSQGTDTYLRYLYTPYLPDLHINHPQSCQKASSPAPTLQPEQH